MNRYTHRSWAKYVPTFYIDFSDLSVRQPFLMDEYNEIYDNNMNNDNDELIDDDGENSEYGDNSEDSDSSSRNSLVEYLNLNSILKK